MMAVNNIDRYYKIDEENAQLLLITKIHKLNITCLDVAVSAEHLNFMSHQATQNSLTILWYGKILPKAQTFPKVI